MIFHGTDTKKFDRILTYSRNYLNFHTVLNLDYTEYFVLFFRMFVEICYLLM